jgi:hypothetical protein
MGSDLADAFGDIFSQAPQIILMPIIFGVLYIILMVVIFRRASERKKKARIARGEPVRTRGNKDSFQPASWTVPAELRGIPEPSIEMLVAPVMAHELESGVSSTPASEYSSPTISSTASNLPVVKEADWLAAVIPQGAALMPDDSKTLPSDAIEVMRVWRDLNDGSIIVQMGEQRYRAMAEIQNPDLARRFVAVVRELWNMVNSGGAKATGTIQPLPPAGAVPPPADNSMVGMKARAAGLLNGAPPAEPPAKGNRLSQGIRAVVGGGSSTPASSEPAGIAGAVEEFLQFKLSTTPQFASRSIHIRPSHDHGIKIEVDGRYFDSIGEVFDADVREYLLSIMKEWEARH